MPLRRGGDHLLAFKPNRPATYDDVARVFADPPADMIETARQPSRTTMAESVCHDVDWLISDRRYPDEPRFPHLAMIAMVESCTERGGKVETERRYYLSSAKLNPKTFAAAEGDVMQYHPTTANTRFH